MIFPDLRWSHPVVAVFQRRVSLQTLNTLRARVTGVFAYVTAVPAVLVMKGERSCEEGGQHKNRHASNGNATCKGHYQQRQRHEGARDPLRSPSNQISLHHFEIVQRMQAFFHIFCTARFEMLATEAAQLATVEDVSKLVLRSGQHHGDQRDYHDDQQSRLQQRFHLWI